MIFSSYGPKTVYGLTNICWNLPPNPIAGLGERGTWRETGKGRKRKRTGRAYSGECREWMQRGMKENGRGGNTNLPV